MIDLNSILPKQESLEEEINAEVADILNYVKKEDARRPNEKEVRCALESIQNTANWEAKGDEPYLFNMDAIYKAIPYIKAANYYCWENIDYKGHLTIWITRRENRPHEWFRQI